MLSAKDYNLQAVFAQRDMQQVNNMLAKNTVLKQILSPLSCLASIQLQYYGLS